MKASDDLRKEHDAILFALGILEKMTSPARPESPINRNDAAAMVDFLKIFADKCHHGKEEGILFPEYELQGIPRTGGPIGVMLEEHEAGRRFLKAMSESLQHEPFDGPAYAAASKDYIDLLRNHIEKENTVLFPAGDARLSDEKNEEFFAQFEKFE